MDMDAVRRRVSRQARHLSPLAASSANAGGSSSVTEGPLLDAPAIARYERDGIVVPARTLSPLYVARLRAALDATLAANPGKRPEQLVSIHNIAPPRMARTRTSPTQRALSATPCSVICARSPRSLISSSSSWGRTLYFGDASSFASRQGKGGRCLSTRTDITGPYGPWLLQPCGSPSMTAPWRTAAFV